MKWFFSFFFVSNLWATPYFLIQTKDIREGEIVALRLSERYGVDLDFIKIKNMECTKDNSYLAARLCINKKGELQVLSFNKKILNITQKIFKRLK